MQNQFKHVGIIYNSDISDSKILAEKLLSKVPNSNLYSINETKKDIDVAIVCGGDGTILKAARLYCETSVPIFGLNVGRLGYLAQAKPDEIDYVIDRISNNHYKIENRLMLKANNGIALNDIVVKGTNCARSQTFDLFINDKNVCSYVADGIIVATPTGSTAYSMSAGGPIISPYLDCFLVIPICPHTLNTRPLIVPKNEKIIIKTLEKLNVSYDGQIGITLDNEVRIEKNENFAKLLILDEQKDRFYDILREKLHWSISPNK